MHLNTFFLIIEDINGYNWVYDYSQVLMISDTIGSRWLSSIYCSIQSQLQLVIVPTMERLLKFYQRIDLWFLEMGKDTYNYIKQLETVCVANYLKRYDKLKASREYFDKLEESKNDQRTQ